MPSAASNHGGVAYVVYKNIILIYYASQFTEEITSDRAFKKGKHIRDRQ